MYPVSNAYKQQILMDDKITRITGSITLVDGNVLEIESDDISILPEITNQCSGDEELILGQAYQGELDFGIYSSVERYKIYGARVELSFGLLIDSVNDEWEEIPLGKYKVSECIRQSTQQLKITALDDMDKFNIKYDGNTLFGSPYTILSYISVISGVELGQSQEEVESLPNGTVTFGVDSSSNITSYRDLIGDLAACLAGFAVIGRDGKLYIRTFNSYPCAVFSEDYRGNDTVSDYQVIYSGVHVTKRDSDIYIGEDTDQMLNLGTNAFLQFGPDETTKEIMQNILDVISLVAFTPSTISIKCSDPAYDLGDLIETTGYTSGDSLLVPIHKILWRWRSELRIESVGKNPFLNPLTKTDKEMESIKSTVDAKAMTYYMARNIAEINLSDGIPQEILEIKFSAKEETSVSIWMEIKINALKTCNEERITVYHDEEFPDANDPSENDVVTTEIGYFYAKKIPIKAIARYYYDDIQISYCPVETWFEDGYHILSLQWFINDVDNITPHSWSVSLELQDGTGIIDINDAMANLHGQSLAAADSHWDGTISITDNYTMSSVGTPEILSITDVAPVFDIQMPEEITPSDDVSYESIGDVSAIDLSDDLSIILRKIIYGLISEDGLYNIVGEEKNGDEYIYNITTEED